LDAIHQLVSEGRIESSGSFSMDVIAAQRKLTSVARLEPGLLLGKLIQAAVAAQATQIRFTLEREGVLAKIHFPEKARTDQRVQHYLATAVALGQALGSRQLYWEASGQRRQFARRESSDGWLNTEGLCLFRFLGPQLGFWESLKLSLSGRHSMHALAHRRTYLCPIPVYLDGVRLNAPRPPRPISNCFEAIGLAARDTPCGQRMSIPPICDLEPRRVRIGGKDYTGKQSFGVGRDQNSVLLEGCREPEVRGRDIPYGFSPASRGHLRPAAGGVVLCNVCDHIGEDLTLIVRHQWEWLNAGHYLNSATALQGHVPHLNARRWIRLGSIGTSELWPIQDGLLLNPIELKRIPPGAQVILPVGDLALDLDQLNLVQDDIFLEFEQRLGAEIQRLRPIRDELGAR
jgi:hypothetical protein